MTQPFLIGEAIRFGWEKTKQHSGVLFQGMLAIFALQIVGSIADRVLRDTLEGFLAAVLVGVVGVIIGAGFTRIVLKLAQGEHATYRDLVPPAPLVWRFFLASLLSGIYIVLGLILLIVPGIYLLLRFSMVRFVALEHEGVRESLRTSAKLTEGVKGKLLGFFIVLLLLNLLGALALMVGLLVTVPVSAIAYAHVYEKLKHRRAH